MGSVQFQIVPCSSLYFFSGSIGPLQCLVSSNYRVLICCTCHSRAVPSLCILALSVCKSLQCLISTLTQGDKGGHLFRLTCLVVLWGRRDPANKYYWHVWGVLAVYGPHWVCFSSRWCVLPGSTLLRLQGHLQEHCLYWALYFPGLSRSGSQVHCKGTDLVGCASYPFLVQAAQRLVSILSQVDCAP